MEKESGKEKYDKERCYEMSVHTKATAKHGSVRKAQPQETKMYE